jgi:hypothetical protein
MAGAVSGLADHDVGLGRRRSRKHQRREGAAAQRDGRASSPNQTSAG